MELVTRLSENFWLEEFACQCGCQSAVVQPELVNALQIFRDIVGRPVRILSGYRCPLNRDGAPDSFHRTGFAADPQAEGLGVLEMFEAAVSIPAFRTGGIGVYDGGFIHADIRPKRARWARLGGNYVGLGSVLLGA